MKNGLLATLVSVVVGGLNQEILSWCCSDDNTYKNHYLPVLSYSGQVDIEKKEEASWPYVNQPFFLNSFVMFIVKPDR